MREWESGEVIKEGQKVTGEGIMEEVASEIGPERWKAA